MGTTERSSLPEGWTKITLGEAAEYLNGRAFKSDEWEARGCPIIRIQNLNDLSAPFNYTKQEYESRYRVDTGDLLFAWSASLGAYIWRHGPAWLNQHIFRVDPYPWVEKAYLYYFLNNIVDHLYAQAHGSGMVHITKKKFYAIPLLLPPLSEQRRIVAKIEELFSELDSGVESLKTARAQLQTYRQSLLKAAFEGRLTERWRWDDADGCETAGQLLQRIREERGAYYRQQLQDWEAAVAKWSAHGKYGKKPSKPSEPKEVSDLTSEELSVLPTIPEYWRYTRLSNLASVGSGMSVSKSRQFTDPVEVPYLRVANVQRGRLDLDSIKYMQVERNSLDDLRLRQWDVLFNEGGDRDKLGRGWVWESQIEPCITQNHVFRATPYLRDEYQAKFISYWGNTFGRVYFEEFGKQTTNLASINKNVLSMFPVPLPPHEEQKEVVKLLELAEGRVADLEQELDLELKRSETLRQSILKRAFEGKLVPQDPNDESASALLERIRQDQEAKSDRVGKNRRREEVTAELFDDQS